MKIAKITFANGTEIIINEADIILNQEFMSTGEFESKFTVKGFIYKKPNESFLKRIIRNAMMKYLGLN